MMRLAGQRAVPDLLQPCVAKQPHSLGAVARPVSTPSQSCERGHHFRCHASAAPSTPSDSQGPPARGGRASAAAPATSVTTTPTTSSAAVTRRMPSHWEKQMNSSPMGKKRVLVPYLALLEGTNALESAMIALSDAELAAKTVEFKDRLALGHSLDSMLQESFAVVREASRRVLNMRHFDAQMVGGIVLHNGQIAEMATGEGKTLVATLPAYLNALEGKGVHIVTVNDYLAARDAEWMGKLYRFLGMSCAAAQSNMSLAEYKAAYASDITYVTGQQLGFSYLGDNTTSHQQDLVLPDTWHYALVDEADSILIDESRNPMITSLPMLTNTKAVKVVDKVVRTIFQLVQDQKTHQDGLIELAVDKARRQGMDEDEIKPMEDNYREIAKKQCNFLYVVDRKQRTAIPTTAGLFVLYKGLEFMGAELSLPVESPEVSTTLTWSEDEDEAEALTAMEQELVQGLVSGTRLEGLPMMLSDPALITRLLRNPVSRPALLRNTRVLEAMLADSVAVSVLERELRLTMGREERKQQIIASSGKTKQSTELLQSLWEGGIQWGRLITTSLQVYEFYLEGRDYIVKDGEVVLVDASTGRLKPMTRWSGGIHQATEAKECVEMKSETMTIAQITFQVFFRAYKKLAGMTGTAAPAAGELYELYDLKVVQIPTNKEKLRKDRPTRLYFQTEDKFRVLVSEVIRCWKTRRPLLIGTATVAESELIMDVLMEYTGNDERCQSVQLLNAKPDKVLKESQVISQAGLPGSVTIATNMAGRGTDIVLGGNPEGLTKLVLMRLIYRHLMTGPDGDSVPPIPLTVFDIFDKAPVGSADKGAMGQWMAELHTLPTGQKLPDVLRQALLAPLLLTSIGTTANLSFQDVSTMVKWVMDRAFVIHRETLVQIRGVYGDKPIEDLEYSVCVAAYAEDMLRDRESSYVAGTQGQQFVVKAAVLLWLYLDQTCARYAEEVRDVGGLLVIGTSLQESKRVELQLRGRAGRQGDPGETAMICDAEDPVLKVYYQSADISTLLGSSVLNRLQFLEGSAVDMMLASTQRTMDCMFSMQRLEGKKYDFILEDYRNSMYTLRRVMLTGSVQQRSQVIYMFIQNKVDALCSQFLDPSQSPMQWLTPSIPQSSLTIPLGKDGKPGKAAAPKPDGPLLSPLQALLRRLHLLLNHDSVVPQTQVEFKTLKDGLVHDVTVQKVMSLFGLDSSGASASDKGSGIGTANKNSQGGSVEVPMDLDEVPILRPAQAKALAAYLSGSDSSPLDWFRGGSGGKSSPDLPLPSAPYTQTFKQGLAMSTHLQIFGMADSSLSADKASDLDAGALPHGLPASLLRRPELKGRYAHKVRAVRNFLGVCMLHAFEMRRLSVRAMLLTREIAVVDIDADNLLWDYEQEVLLQWIDALWSCFLEEVDKLKRAVYLRSFASSHPMTEFRIEANRSFLACLDAYREAVVERVLAPSMSFAVPISQQQEEKEAAPAQAALKGGAASEDGEGRQREGGSKG